MIILSLASKQSWPQILSVLRLKPDTVVLLHTNDSNESKSPTERLRRFFINSGLLRENEVVLELIPHLDFDKIERRLDEIVKSRNFAITDCIVNLTGGRINSVSPRGLPARVHSQGKANATGGTNHGCRCTCERESFCDPRTACHRLFPDRGGCDDRNEQKHPVIGPSETRDTPERSTCE